MVAFSTQNVNDGAIFDGPTEIYVDNVFIGATVGGVELSLNTQMGEKTADQTPLLLGSYIKQQRGMLKFDLEELTLDNMRLVLATPALSAGSGNKSLQPTSEIKFVGNAPFGGTRTVTIWKGRFTGNTSGKYELGESVAYNVELHMEADQTKADGLQYFSLADA